jgi:hypothetical protein
MKKFLLIIGLVIAAVGIYILSIVFAPVPSLDSSLSKLKAQGIPTTLEELVPYELPDSENGALVYKEAFAIFDAFEQKYKTGDKYPNEYRENWKYLTNKEEYLKAPEDKKKEAALIITNDPDLIKMYGLISVASKMRCQFHKRIEYKDGFGLLTSELMQIRGITKILLVKACVESELNLYDESVNSSSLIMKMSNSLENEPCLISQLVRESICIMGVDSLGNNGAVLYAKEDINKDCLNVLCKIDNKNAAKAGFKGEPILAYYTCADLLNASYGNRFSSLQALGIFTDKPSIGTIHSYLLGYLNPKRFLYGQMIFYFNEMSRAYVVLDKPYYEGNVVFKNMIDSIAKGPNNDMILVNLIFPAIDKFYLRGEETGAYINVASLGIANRLYKIKHGKFVDSLSELAPEILQSIPKDPFSGFDYIYKKEGDGFIIYSLGENMKDDNGKFENIGAKGDFDITWQDSGK